MRRQRVTPLPQLGQPGGAVALVVAGIIVLLNVPAAGGLLVGCALVAYGVGQLIDRKTAQVPTTAASEPVMVSPGLTERRVRERRSERITIERWPAAS